ncbi:hypothetical protein KFL_002780130 [Klebsormidium nitens]|uniref:Uncharacterized protein n=1 Tax=Klebsormidium nitens TaxID=105231 RepID=A0A1Y1I9Z1_KLENI|nr:hypothetical protein KFL_002780130 [Klebsormidium nitens]|eukprot:GAQ86249.1 hypothetical protein KFL_002780130 [Klebsormidium nitens]
MTQQEKQSPKAPASIPVEDTEAASFANSSVKSGLLDQTDGWMLQPGGEVATKDKAAARQRAQEALDAVQRAVEGDKLWGNAEWRRMSVNAKEEKWSSQQDRTDKAAAPPLNDTLRGSSSAHHPCICACLSTVLGPRKLPRGEHRVATPNGLETRSGSWQEASGDEDTDVGEESFEDVIESEKGRRVVEERYDPESEEGDPRARRAAADAQRAAERARLERLCLELARLEARLQDVVTRGRTSRPRGSSYESRPRNPSYESRPRTASYESEGSPQFEDKRTIFERAAPVARRAPPEDYKPRSRGAPWSARAHAPGAQIEPQWGKSEAAGLARGAYEAARMCRLGVKPCAYRRRNSAGERAGKGRGHEDARCCDGCGSPTVEPTWATCADVGRGIRGEELVRLKRHHRALSAHCRRQVSALREVAARARVAEGLATRAARAAAAATHPAAGSLCGPAAVCRSREGGGPLWLC